MLFGHHDLLRTIPDFKCIVIVSRQLIIWYVCLTFWEGMENQHSLQYV